MLIGDIEYLKPSAGYDWKCRRCGHQWCYRGPRMADPEPPAQCAGCRSAYWNRPKGKPVKKSGPKPKPQSTSYPIDAPMIHPLLAPPPHLRPPSYFPPEPEPAPENTITKPDESITPEVPDEPPQA